MDKESITQYAWIIIAVLVFAALVVFATPLGEDISVSFISLVKGQQEEVNSVYSEDSMKEQQNYMEQLFDATDLQQPGLYKHNDASKYTYTWAELQYYDIMVLNETVIDKTNNKEKLSGDLIIDEKITELKGSAFSNCSNLELVRLGKTTKTIGSYTFQNCTNLKTFISDINLNTIGDYAFVNCNNLENVYINKNVKLIGEEAFSGCDKLKIIYYDGTIEQWNNITRLTNSTGMTVEKIVCLDGEVEV